MDTPRAHYTFTQHVHNYAVWTAARAVSRNFTTTALVKNAIEVSDLQSFVTSSAPISHEEFDRLHRVWANQLISELKKTTEGKASYGRAAKIISIYLKTAVVLCNKGECKKSAVIHPPIDAILLNNLASNCAMPELKNEPWTTLDELKYWALVQKLRTTLPKFDWTLEFYWSPEREVYKSSTQD